MPVKHWPHFTMTNFSASQFKPSPSHGAAAPDWWSDVRARGEWMGAGERHNGRLNLTFILSCLAFRLIGS